MKIKYGWNPEFPKPEYWDTRTPLHLGMPKFFHLYQDLNDKKLRVFLKKLKGKILDAGCGGGRFIAYADVGVDFSKGMLNRARSKFPHKCFVQASISHLPFKDKTFSVVFTVDVLLHIEPEKREEVVKELYRVADACYNFLGEHRTVMYFILQLLKDIPFKPIWLFIPNLVVLFAFPFDRVKKLKVSLTSQVLRRM